MSVAGGSCHCSKRADSRFDPELTSASSKSRTAASPPKRLDLVRQLVPNAVAVAMLVNPGFQLASAEVRNVQDAARILGIQINILNASTESEIVTAFANMIQQKAGALIVGTDPFLLGQWQRATLFPQCIFYVSSSRLVAC
jgi:hypothetical protein